MENDGLPLYPQVYPQAKAVSQKETINMQHPNHHKMHHQSPSGLGPQQAPPIVLLGPENTVTVCPFCHASIKSAVKYTTNSRTHIAAAICCLACCCCIPYAMDSAKNADHYCPNCQRYIGTYHK